jgi:hypothetical protein
MVIGAHDLEDGADIWWHGTDSGTVVANIAVFGGAFDFDQLAGLARALEPLA